MKDSFKSFIAKTGRMLKSRQGKNMLTFCIFVFISAILWGVLTLNEEDTYDIRFPVRLDRVPDSVTIVTTAPNFINASIRSQGSKMLKFELGREPEVVIDFRRYANDNYIRLRDADIKTLIRNIIPGANIGVVSPDSLSIGYTTRAGVALPIETDLHITSGPQTTILGRPELSIDSARVYSIMQLPSKISSVKTEAINITDINKDMTVKAKLLAPPRTRVIPDSVLIYIKVQPLIAKSRKIVIEPLNVPAGVKLITFPTQIKINYMVPMNMYSTVNPKFRVTADYKTIRAGSKKIKVNISNVPSVLQNVQLETDSVEFIIEK